MVLSVASDSIAVRSYARKPLWVSPTHPLGRTIPSPRFVSVLTTNRPARRGRFHRCRQLEVDIVELVFGPAWHLGDDVVDCGFERCSRLAGNFVLDLVEAFAECDLRGHAGDWISRCLRGERRGARDTRVDLDDAVFAAADGEVELPQFDRDEHFHDNGTLGEDCQLDGEEAEYECDLLGLPSFDLEDSHVQDVHADYLGQIADLGADGLRYDAAGHIWPWYFESELNALADDLDLWRVGEVWDYDVERLLEFADTGMTVFDFPLYDAIVDAFEGGSMAELSQDAARGVVHERPEAAVTFVQNHDTVGPRSCWNDSRVVHLVHCFGRDLVVDRTQWRCRHSRPNW